MDVAAFKRLPILGILRGIRRDALEPLAAAITEGGLRTVEITMNTPGAGDLIAGMARLAGGRLVVGAGTVLDMGSLRAALDAGATFIVMPVIVEEVMEHCRRNGIPVFPGALTPGEIYRARQLGATMVKVFPSGAFGPKYFSEVKGPFNDIELLACGGVTPATMKDFFAAGASAVAFGASVFRGDWLEKNDYASIAKAVRAFVDAYGTQGGRA